MTTIEVPDLVIEMLRMASEEMSEGQEAARAHVSQAINLLRQQSAPLKRVGAKSRSCLAPWQRRLVEVHIEQHLDSPIKLHDLAAVARLSSSYFSVAFKRDFGETPRAYLNRKRIARAMKMMLKTDESLSCIAVACGLSDQSHFSRLFRSIEGISPARWRKLMSSVPPRHQLAEGESPTPQREARPSHLPSSEGS